MKKKYLISRGAAQDTEINLFSLIRTMIFQKKSHYILMLSLFLLVALISMLPPIMTGYLVKKGVINSQVSVIYNVTMLLLLVTVTTGLLNFFKVILFKQLQTHFITNIQTFIIERILQLPLAFFDQHTVGELTHRALIVESLTQLFSEHELGAYLSLVCALIGFSMMMYFDWQLTGCVLLMVLLFLMVSTWSSLRIVPKLETYLELTGQSLSFLFQVISGILRIKSLGKESVVSSIATDKYSQTRSALFAAHQLGIWRFTLFKNIQLLMMLLLFVVITVRTQHTLPFEKFIVFFSAYTQLVVSFVLFSLNTNSLVFAITTYKRIKPIVQTRIENSYPMERGLLNCSLFPGDISIKNLYFRYPTSHSDVLKDINCTIPFAQHTAFVGLSGSGKSTLLKLLLGLYSPQQGEINFGESPIQQLDLSTLRQEIGIVFQDSKLMNGTILENIVGFDGNEDEAWRVAGLIGLDILINSLPMKMHTIVSQHLNLISGGQKQLLLIAKALVGNPRLLILDEATNSLDNISQAMIVRCIQRLNITRISIAHRLSTIKDADQIIVLHQGKITQAGSYQQLMQQQDGFFHELVKRQLVDW